jgi:hypothetical protein
MSPAPDEVARIEHELDILRSRYAIFQRWARVTKWFFIVVAAIVPPIIAIFVSDGVVRDPLAAAVVAAIVLVIGGGLYLTRNRNYRWIDVVSIPPGWPWGRVFNIGPKSEAAAIETMIAEREARLVDVRKRQT